VGFFNGKATRTTENNMERGKLSTTQTRQEGTKQTDLVWEQERKNLGGTKGRGNEREEKKI